MLKGIIICESQELGDRLSNVLGITEKISIKRKLTESTPSAEVLRILQTQAPDVIFLSFESRGTALELLEALEAEGNRAHVIGIRASVDIDLLHDMMRAGVRECLSEPFDTQKIVDILHRLKAKPRPNSHAVAPAQVFSFLPSKAGVGTSTVALNVSAALARQPDTRVLLSDFDLTSGMLDFLLKLGKAHSVLDALERASELDEDLWGGLVSKVDKLHVLQAGVQQPNLAIEGARVRNLIASGAGVYEAMCFDLSGNMEPYSIDILRESRRIVLVCTPEASSLHLARKKLSALRDLDLEDRVAILVNRVGSGDVLSRDQIQQLLGVPVMKMVPNNYPEVNRAIEGGKCVPADSKLGQVFEQFACILLERSVPSGGNAKKTRLLDFFSSSREIVSTRTS